MSNWFFKKHGWKVRLVAYMKACNHLPTVLTFGSISVFVIILLIINIQRSKILGEANLGGLGWQWETISAPDRAFAAQETEILYVVNSLDYGACWLLT